MHNKRLGGRYDDLLKIEVSSFNYEAKLYANHFSGQELLLLLRGDLILVVSLVASVSVLLPAVARLVVVADLHLLDAAEVAILLVERMTAETVSMITEAAMTVLAAQKTGKIHLVLSSHNR